jgi:hypothetical protein
MWRNWSTDTVEADFARLAAHGLQLIRLFPLWPDFQPITQLRGSGGVPVEIRFGEEPLPPGPLGQAGVSAVMVERLATVCELAQRHGLQLIVGLVTGWMSGRLFVPPALEGLDPITDATSLAWQIKFVRALTTALHDQPAIVAWDLGNESNCMGDAPTRDAAYLWTAALTHAIRAGDATRPVISGMHSLKAGTRGLSNPWTIDDQGALTDLLTTHPYPYWTRHTRNDAVDSLRTSLHATAETRFYADIAGKPCFAEEIGTMGPMVAGDEISAGFARINLFSLWANDCRGFLWWCAHDQTELAFAPYDWIGVEPELGLLRIEGTAKPVLHEMHAFTRFLRTLPFATLPRLQPDAVCILTHTQDDWAAAFGSFILAKQARLEIEFRHVEQELPDSPVYLLPSLKGHQCIPRRRWLELIERTKAGATLYLSLGDGIVPHFNAIAGVELLTRAKPTRPCTATFVNTPDLPFPLPGGDDLRFAVHDAEVLAHRDGADQPIFWRHRLGQGWVYVLAAPLETELTTTPGAFAPNAPAYHTFYHHLTAHVADPRWLDLPSPALAVTEHPLTDATRAVIVINHTTTPQRVSARPAPGVTLGRPWRGDLATTLPGALEFTVPAQDACVFELRRSN